jgi:diguanylate cyclase (GGDEF)-like protein
MSAATELGDIATTIFARTQALVLLVDDEQRLVAVNAAAAAAAGLDAGSLVSTDATAFVAVRDAPDFRRALREASRGLPSSQEHALPVTDGGRHRSIAWSIARAGEEPCVVACVGIDVTSTRDEVEMLRNRAITDQLTGLPNRAALLEHLQSMVGSGANVVFCDLNGFKHVNDTLGHAAGDAVLVQTARRLTRTVRGEDFVARLGGDEFVIVVPPDADASFEGLARRLLRAIEQPMVLPGGVVATVGMSVGDAVLSPGASPESVLTIADANMYKMKSRRPTRTSSSAA